MTYHKLIFFFLNQRLNHSNRNREKQFQGLKLKCDFCTTSGTKGN